MSKVGWCGSTGGPEGPGDPPDEEFATCKLHQDYAFGCRECFSDMVTMLNAMRTQNEQLAEALQSNGSAEQT